LLSTGLEGEDALENAVVVLDELDCPAIASVLPTKENLQ
jgi:hypothetical protein